MLMKLADDASHHGDLVGVCFAYSMRCKLGRRPWHLLCWFVEFFARKTGITGELVHY